MECGGREVISVHMTPDAKRFLCLGEESHSDLWIAENLEPIGPSSAHER